MFFYATVILDEQAEGFLAVYNTLGYHENEAPIKEGQTYSQTVDQVSKDSTQACTVLLQSKLGLASGTTGKTN